jgi:3-hydroxyisobutyrate dehydrogenase
MSTQLGFIGLGVMGEPMAGHLQKKQGAVTVWNRTPGKADALVEAGATLAPTVQSLGESCDIVFLCVRGGEDTVELASSLAECMASGSIVVDHSTTQPAAAIEASRILSARGVAFVDAPITGGSMGAKNGTLTIFLGGETSDCERVSVPLSAYAKKAQRVGGVGSGQWAKLANQIAVAGSLLGLCESLSFAKKAGLDVRQIHELLSGGAAGSWAFDNYGPKLLNEDWSPGFSIDNQQKDLIYTMEAAGEVDAAVPMTALASQLLELLQQEGDGGKTTAALYAKMLDLKGRP